MNTNMKANPSVRLSGLSTSWILVLAVAGVACGGSELERRDLGNTSEASVSDPSDETPLSTQGGIDTFVAGHWVGRAEDVFSPPGADGERLPYTFPSGAQEITLDLSLPDPIFQELSGQIVFGAGPVPEPAAGVVYPPGMHPNLDGNLSAVPPLEGFAYTVTGSSLPMERAVAVSYMPSESYTDWCALQPARSDGTGHFDCITTGPAPDPLSVPWCNDFSTGRTVHYECSLAWLCQACNCTQAGCTVSFAEPPVQLLLTRSGADLLGSFVRTVFDYGDAQSYLPVGSVRFRRQAP